MMRRPPVARRGPGLVGTMARTAVIAGTATATSRAVSGSMEHSAQQKQMAAEQQQMMAQQAQDAQAQTQQSQAQIEQMQAQMAAMQAQQAQAQMAAMQAQPAQQAGTASPGGGTDMMAQLQQLAKLKESGILSDEEFQAAKAKLLGM
jgi:putative oligomerization/nucleic acid binding protein